MITVYATDVRAATFQLSKLKIRKENMEMIRDLGTYPCKANGQLFDGPICYVYMLSGRGVFISGTSAELEARSA